MQLLSLYLLYTVQLIQAKATLHEVTLCLISRLVLDWPSSNSPQTRISEQRTRPSYFGLQSSLFQSFLSSEVICSANGATYELYKSAVLGTIHSFERSKYVML